MEYKIISSAVGSLPHKDTGKAINLVTEIFSEAPFWPQLPKRDFREGMYIQYCEGFPGAVLDQEKQRLFFTMDGNFASAKEKFLEALMQDDLESFAMSAEYADGFYAFLEAYKGKATPPPMVKGQVTGPISLGLTVTDENNRSILYNPEFEEIITNGLMMKARWQARKLLEICPQAIIFIDEPYLASFGSAFISLEREQVIQAISLVSEAIKGEGAKSGAHCCGNTDWTLLMEAGVDLINFDAVAYAESMTLYAEKLRTFLENGGSLAWGIVPNSEAVRVETTASAVKRFWEGIHALEARGIPRDLLLSSAWITPCCGAGTMQEADAEKMIRLANDAAEAIKQELR
jgi:methionine synthase II (cobalamin-independent)